MPETCPPRICCFSFMFPDSFSATRGVNLIRERGRDRNSPACCPEGPHPQLKKKKEFWIITSFWLIYTYFSAALLFLCICFQEKDRLQGEVLEWLQASVSFCTHPQCHSHCIGGAGKEKGKFPSSWSDDREQREKERVNKNFKLGLPWRPSG